MPRKPRIDLPTYPLHVLQRGNNKQTCFNNTADFKAYEYWLKQYSVQFDVSIHAWVFMTNHVHILCTPNKSNAISDMMQSLGRQYVRYFNDKYKRTGTLWEGRYKACLVEDDAYLIQLYKYIELNPVRANMVTEPELYVWSSFQINALGKDSSLCAPHQNYMRLGNTKEERQLAYLKLFKEGLPLIQLEKIRESTKSGLVFGSDKFADKMESITGLILTKQKPGRPWDKETEET
jgi:putative transposase